MVDTLGLLLAVAVHPANIQDRDGAKLVLERLLGQYPRLKVIWADGAYGGKLVQWACMDSNQRPRSYQGFGQKPTEFRPLQIQNARCTASFFGIGLWSIVDFSGGPYH